MSKDIRYYFEHRFLRDCYYADPPRFIKTMLDESDAMYHAFDRLCREKGVSNPYEAWQFHVNALWMTDGTRALRLILPQVLESTQCYCIYVFFAEKGTEKGFFCLEASENDVKDGPFLTQWLKDGTYIIHEQGYREKEQDFLKCAELFRETDPDMLRKLILQAKKDGSGSEEN